MWAELNWPPLVPAPFCPQPHLEGMTNRKSGGLEPDRHWVPGQGGHPPRQCPGSTRLVITALAGCLKLPQALISQQVTVASEQLIQPGTH